MKICWYARDGHIDFMPRLAMELSRKGYIVRSYFVCHTSREEVLLNKLYNVKATSLSGSLPLDISINDESYMQNVKHYEVEYDKIPLRRLLWSEMFEKKYSEGTLIRHLVEHFKFWERYLTQNNIEAVVSERPSILSTNILWTICQKYGIRFIEPLNLGIDDRIVFTDSWSGAIKGFNEKFSNLKDYHNSQYLSTAKEYIKKTQVSYRKPKYLTTNLQTGEPTTGNKIYHSRPKIGNIFTFWRRLKIAQGRQEYYNNLKPSEATTNFVIHMGRTILHRFINIFDQEKIDQNEKYFLFPLHVNNEWVNYQWMGLHYPYPINLIRKISASLPLGTKLYVKEHPSGFPDRPVSFYRKIKQINRVRLIGPETDTNRLLKNSQGIITLGGTMGWEAFIIGRPVFTIGKSWYDNLPGVYHINNLEEMVELLQKCSKFSVNENDQIRAVVALYELGFAATRYPVPDLIAMENIAKFVDPLAQALGISKQ